MSIPPFPSQDLAKLVLGYLAEEQLMTAYDEFLQGSPYLDALRNEYDRIFMTSLKSILAEYRAVKIYVDTCKPFVLRKKIFQCSNLLEIVKFLIANVDIKKIQQQETVAITSTEKQNVTVVPQVCELCTSLSLLNCVCKNRTSDVSKQDVNYAEASSLQNSVETTPLADLPGNYVTTRKKHIIPLDTQINSNINSLQNSDSSAKQSFSSHISPEEYLARCENSPTLNSDETSLTMNVTAKAVEPTKSTRNIEEFNNVLKSIVVRNKTLPSSESSSNQIISKPGTFQDFSSGVSGGENHSATYNVPDSSTSENLNVRAPIIKDVYNESIKGPPQQLMLQVNHVNDAFEIQTCKSVKPPKLLPKTLERQIQILSDVKVDNKLHEKINCKKKKTKTAINATSTPVMHMKTIMINGTPAYKHTPNTHTFTKDEIMAMPTLIVVPASGPSQIPTSAPCNPIIASNSIISDANNSQRVLGPLVIDVPPNAVVTNKSSLETLPDLSVEKPVTDNLVKTVDVKSSNGTAASVPKDNVISLHSNTPQVQPPLRKSSSTPRRNSHIRVLDFTTPRRILHETINEVPVQTCPPVEVVSSQNVESSQTTVSEAMEIKSEIIVVVKEESTDTGSAKENETANKAVKAKKYDWDADLRALVANEKPGNVSHRKPKPKASKKKKSIDKASTSKVTDSKKKTRKQSPRVKKAISRNVEELEDEPIPTICKTCDVPYKPNIKIIYGDKYDKTATQVNNTDSNSTKNKPQDKVDECIETPEAERLSLQNVIGAKLNISDFLETPYKQVLYDIQMETPKFLGPDLPDVPLSNVKITDIPTPRFLNNPNFAQATPSSYSSRPTDYSSGGSYYKPDDQDYIPVPDFLTCPVTSSSSSKEETDVEKAAEKECEEKKSRPVRQCAKNVSYYRHSGAVKTKDVEDNVDAALSCSGTAGTNSSFELKSKKEITDTKIPRAKSQNYKSESRKKTSSSNRIKTSKDSALKDKTKTFMKIKPKCTPIKGTPARNRKPLLKSPYSKRSPHVLPGKKTTSKDKVNVNVTSLNVPAATKSRRKSSTPRKLHCTKSFDPEDSHDSSTTILNTESDRNLETIVTNSHDSDTEQLALRWSDEGSLDNRLKDSTIKPAGNESEDINKIQEFIVSTGVKNINDGTLQQDLMKRGFDLETAKIIERDLLDDSPMHAGPNKPISEDIFNTKENELIHEKTSEPSSKTNELQIAQEKSDDDEETELTVHECNEDTNNYFMFKHNDTKEIALVPPIQFKDNYCAEICIDDMTVKLRLTPFRSILDYDPLTVDEIDYSYKETEQAVNSISGMDRLYTPLKDSYKSQCFEIFDSTLTSIDTPLKTTSPLRNACNVSVTELVLEESQKTEGKIHVETKNRKRARSSSNDSANSSKRTKPDADLLLKAANIQNIDIETVLTKLHGH